MTPAQALAYTYLLCVLGALLIAATASVMAGSG